MKNSATLSILTLLGSSFASPAPNPVVEKNYSFTTLDTRARYGVEMAFGAATGGFMFAYNAAGACPATADDSNVNNAQCGISATASAFSFAFAAWQAHGVWKYGAPPTKRKRDSAVPIALPLEDTTLLKGHSITMKHVGLSHPPGSRGNATQWNQFSVVALDLTHGHVRQATLHVHPTEVRHMVSVDAPAPSSGDKLAKRTNIQAIYSTASEDKFYYDQTDTSVGTTNHLAEDTWNHAHFGFTGAFCANVETDGGHLWNQGYYYLGDPAAYQDLSGTC